MRPLAFRPASADEPLPYLADPAFSSCTVPVVHYSHHMINAAHMLRDNAARLYGALQESPWGEHAKVILFVPMGLEPPRFARQVMAAVNPAIAMETWGQLGARLPSQPVRRGARGPPPRCRCRWRLGLWLICRLFGCPIRTSPAHPAPPSPPGRLPPQAPGGGYQPMEVEPPAEPGAAHSWEGGPQRCFRHMFVCHQDYNISHWPLHEFGQRLVRQYWPDLPLQARVTLEGTPAEALQRRLASAAAPAGSSDGGGSSSSAGDGPHVLNIVWHRRGLDRMILNAPELLERCNEWRHTTPDGTEVRAKCWEVRRLGRLAGRRPPSVSLLACMPPSVLLGTA